METTSTNLSVATPKWSQPDGGLEEDGSTVAEPVDMVCLSDTSDRQLQYQLLTMNQYARAGRLRPGVYGQVYN